MAASSPLFNFLSLFTQSKPPPPITSLSSLPLSSSKTRDELLASSSILVSNEGNCYGCSSTSSSSPSTGDITSVVYPSIAYANTLFFKSGYNVQVIVDEHEHEEKLIGRFRREVMRAGVIQECKRRRFHENKQDEKKRKSREAAKRNRRRRTPFRTSPQDKQEVSTSKKAEDDEDNWDLPVGDLPN